MLKEYLLPSLMMRDCSGYKSILFEVVKHDSCFNAKIAKTLDKAVPLNPVQKG